MGKSGAFHRAGRGPVVGFKVAVSQLVMPVETLECYGIQGCGDYPGSRFTAMGSISLRSTTGAISASFAPVNAVTDCGQHCVVDSAPGSAVELWYAGG
jgi:hypothetical protein